MVKYFLDNHRWAISKISLVIRVVKRSCIAVACLRESLCMGVCLMFIVVLVWNSIKKIRQEWQCSVKIINADVRQRCDVMRKTPILETTKKKYFFLSSGLMDIQKDDMDDNVQEDQRGWCPLLMGCYHLQTTNKMYMFQGSWLMVT